MGNIEKKQIIGRLEYVDLPDFNLTRVESRVDTGAYHSALHAENIQEETIEGKKVLTFNVLDDSHLKYNNKKFTSVNFRKIKITSSNGVYEIRYLIPVTVMLGGKKIISEFSLTSRKGMKRSLLLGRLTIRKDFIVDAEKSFLMDKS